MAAQLQTAKLTTQIKLLQDERESMAYQIAMEFDTDREKTKNEWLHFSFETLKNQKTGQLNKLEKTKKNLERYNKTDQQSIGMIKIDIKNQTRILEKITEFIKKREELKERHTELNNISLEP